jgi:hypothetical protein
MSTETPGEPLPDWERDLIALDARRAKRFTAWRKAQLYTDPTGKLAEAFEAGWHHGAAHVANPTAADYDRAAEELAKPAARYALVEQMGHRATVAVVSETVFCGKPMLDVTNLKTGSTHLISPESLYEVTWLTEDEARARAKPWTAVALPCADPWGVSESDDDTDPDEGKDDGMSTSEREAYDRDAEFRLDAADEARDLEREAEAHL